VASPTIAAEGVTNPSIDDLLSKTDSKYKLVLYSAQRARQINAYYSQLGEGLLEYVGPLVDTHVQEKPLSIALREINDDLLTCEDIDPAAEAAAAEAAAEMREVELVILDAADGEREIDLQRAELRVDLIRRTEVDVRQLAQDLVPLVHVALIELVVGLDRSTGDPVQLVHLGTQLPWRDLLELESKRRHPDSSSARF
jgi:DNA-directed RNA polymerase subunit omega